MSPVGRPKKENARNVNLNIRISKVEADKIQQCADDLHTTRTDAIIKGIDLLTDAIKQKK